jgi:hypothetical protein
VSEKWSAAVSQTSRSAADKSQVSGILCMLRLVEDDTAARRFFKTRP